MRGFELVLKQGMSLNLSSLFHGIDFGGVTIHVVQSEIINQKTFVHHDHYMADCLASAMKGLPYHLDGLIHNLLAFVYPKAALPSEIRTYEDYLGNL